jgi:hypothetical protein
MSLAGVQRCSTYPDSQTDARIGGEAGSILNRDLHMKPSKSILLLVWTWGGLASLAATAATIPAGTTLVVKTTSTISSRDTAGKPFQGSLLRDVEVEGKVVLTAGTPVAGVVESPRVQIGSSTRPLSLKLVQVSIHGRMKPLKTESFETENAGIKGRRGIRLTGGAFLLPPGTNLQFRLSQPLNL